MIRRSHPGRKSEFPLTDQNNDSIEALYEEHNCEWHPQAFEHEIPGFKIQEYSVSWW